MADQPDYFTRAYPDEDALAGPPGTSIADRLRRAALYLTLAHRNIWRDPGHTLLPWTKAAGTLVRAAAPELANRMRRTAGMEPIPSYTPLPEDDLSGRYVGPRDMILHQVYPGYVPRQEFENAVQQDPLADWLGPMQKPAPKQPFPTSGY